MTFDGSLGILLALIGLAGTGALGIWPDQLWIGAILVSTAVAGAAALFTYIYLGRRNLLERSGSMLVYVSVFLIVLGSVLGLIGALEMDKKAAPKPQDLSKNDGILLPSNQKTPELPNKCILPDNSLAVFLGTDVAWATFFPHVVLRSGKDELITIDREGDRGPLTIKTLRVYGEEQRVIASIKNSEFWVSPIVRKARPDQISLIVYDERDHEALHIAYLNPHALMITGTFRHPEITPRVYKVSEAGTLILPENMSVGKNCIGNGGFRLTKSSFAMGG